MVRRSLLLGAALLVAGCGQGPASRSANDAAETPANHAATPANATAPTAAGQGPVLRSETVSGTFAGWEMGDYLWARIEAPGREPVRAQPGPSPIDLFLDAHRGRPVTVEVATVRTNIPEAGGETEIQRIVAARSGATSAQAWWQALSAADHQAAQRRFEEGALSGR